VKAEAGAELKAAPSIDAPAKALMQWVSKVRVDIWVPPFGLNI
jgi:hypothetical protein